MRKKIKPKEESASPSRDGYFIISPEKKKRLIGILSIVLALFIFLSILSYSRDDESSFSYSFLSIFKLFDTNPEFQAKAAATHNWLGILGAYVSFFSSILLSAIFRLFFQ